MKACQGTLLLLVLSNLLLFSHCTKASVLYVRPDNHTVCPLVGDYCLTLSEYANNTARYFTRDTSLVFLPGQHVLNTPMSIDNSFSSMMSFSAFEKGNVTINCIDYASFGFKNIDYLEIRWLAMCSCSSLAYSVGRVIVENCTLYNSLFPVFYLDNTTMVSTGGMYVNNTNIDAWFVLLDLSTLVFTDNSFTNNSGNGMYISNSSVFTNGTNVFSDNTGTESAVFRASQSNISLSGFTRFFNNKGGVLVGSHVNVQLNGDVTFQNNEALYGSSVTVVSSRINISGNVTFLNNRAVYGGAVYAASSMLYVLNESFTAFFNNSALTGGSTFLLSSSAFVFNNNQGSGRVKFQGNSAEHEGGALYVQDANPLTYCLRNHSDKFALQDCFFQVPNPFDPQTVNMFFDANHAQEAGDVLFGGAVDSCVIPDGDSYAYGSTVFNELINISLTSGPSVISSTPFMLCICVNGSRNCSQTSVSRKVYPGGVLELPVIALGQRNGTVPAAILWEITGHQIRVHGVDQRTETSCTNILYTVHGQISNRGTMVVYADGPCLTVGSTVTVDIEIVACPPGFEFSYSTQSCGCNERLEQYTHLCNITDKSITRNGVFWVGYDEKSNDIILYPNCPFDFCVTDEVKFKIEDSDKQCSSNRIGLLCGGCREGYSLLLGGWRCEKCSSTNLALLVFFAVAGALLVAFLVIFNLTVALGTINGLVFYANIVVSNQGIFFPSRCSGYLEFLKVFVAWINLDFGIETCFYDGMDAYAKAWLEYAFPVYMWLLIAMVFVIASRASRVLGSNPVAVLATILLLSYTKLLRTVIEGLTSATLEYPQGHTRQVWLYDGNLPFLDPRDGKHLGLFSFSLAVLLFLFVPYIVLLLTSQWLLVKSHWGIFSWLNRPRLQSFLDAYHAPYKPKHRYWNGLLLLVRFAVLLTSALNTFSNPAVNLLVVHIFLLAVLVMQWVNGGVYRNWYLDLLESFFILNILFFVTSTFYVNFKLSTSQIFPGSLQHQSSQETVVYTLVTAAFIAFLGIIGYHAYLKLHKAVSWRKFYRKLKFRPQRDEKHKEEDTDLLSSQAPTTSYVTISKHRGFKTN